MPFRKENLRAGLPPNSTFQVGVSNVDDGRALERDILLPWPDQPQASWVYYDCTVGVMLDSGIAIHNRLPQVNYLPDTLAMCDLDDPKLDSLSFTGGVNLTSRDQYADIMQRMGHSRYWFRLWGQALRIGQQVPIPGMKSVGGVPTVPYDRNPQWAFNRIFPGGNYGGVILWHAAWSLWYTTLVPPRNQDIPASDPSAHISRKVPPPQAGMQAPYSREDDASEPAAPGGNPIFTVPGGGGVNLLGPNR